MVSSAFIEFNNDHIRHKASFSISATFSLSSLSDKGSKIIVLGIGGNGKLNLQIACLRVLMSLQIYEFA